MEIKEPDRVVVAKPVASRPTCSNFRSFTELLAGAINASPPNVCSETTVPAIRPKTVRFKPMANRAATALPSSQAEPSGTAAFDASDRVSKSDCKPTIIYKPQAKLVSKKTVSLLANMGNFSRSQQHHAVASVDTRVWKTSQERNKFATQQALNLQTTPSRAETERTTESSKLVSHSQNQEDGTKSSAPTANTDRPSYDGYNWRKYGQKQVKGSEYPRSYYKCTHPNCPVKKKVERSLDGQIAEIVYKGEHNHPKPQPPKRNSSGTQGLVSDATAQDTDAPLWSSNINEGSESRVETQNETRLPSTSTYQSKPPPSYDHARTGSTNVGAGNSDNSLGLSGECDEASKGLEDEDDEPRSKRRKTANQFTEAGISENGAAEPRVVMQSSTDSEILDDGFRWRKYGQKVVKGNPYPRSYYRCTSLKCNVRKHVERASDDPRAFITTYEGKHNHDMPLKSPNSEASEPDLQKP
ncbi:hypothetical protein K2173_019448 [Erythroxylum novogranatense]|uniref:WRKY domain-containing protein n=1 Tax=Erythroxylum novogranatense TaxID=1862640 RepID=A0AAV8UBH1_9ROSI|nr:hypothetical protein K2173_019448 [Erythroxylum novogranatense]